MAGAIWDGPQGFRLGDGLREPLERSLSAIAHVLRAWEEEQALPPVFADAGGSLDVLAEAVAAAHAGTPQRVHVGALAPGAAAALDVQRILTALRQHLLPEEREAETG